MKKINEVITKRNSIIAAIFVVFVVFVGFFALYRSPHSVLLSGCRNGDIKAVMSAIERGAEVNRPGRKRAETPLGLAIESNSPEIVEYLIRIGADPLVRHKERQLPIDTAMRLERLHLVDLIIKTIISTDKMSPLLGGVLSNIIKYDDLRILTFFENYIKLVAERDQPGFLVKALDLKATKAFTYILGHFDNIPQNFLDDLLFKVFNSGLYELISPVVQAGGNIEARNSSGDNLISLAVRENNIKGANILRGLGAKIQNIDPLIISDLYFSNEQLFTSLVEEWGISSVEVVSDKNVAGWFESYLGEKSGKFSIFDHSKIIRHLANRSVMAFSLRSIVNSCVQVRFSFKITGHVSHYPSDVRNICMSDMGTGSCDDIFGHEFSSAGTVSLEKLCDSSRYSSSDKCDTHLKSLYTINAALLESLYGSFIDKMAELKHLKLKVGMGMTDSEYQNLKRKVFDELFSLSERSPGDVNDMGLVFGMGRLKCTQEAIRKISALRKANYSEVLSSAVSP